MIQSPHTRPWMQTRTGKRYYFDAPSEAAIDIRDVASGLAKTCRFNGQCEDFISVAEHSVAVSRLVEKRHNDAMLSYAALLHDASEAFMGDVSTPHKSLIDMEGYRTREAVAMRSIEKQFRIPRGMTHDPRVKAADLDCLAVEAQYCFGKLDPGWMAWLAGAKTEDVNSPACLDWREAEKLFLERFKLLKAKL